MDVFLSTVSNRLNVVMKQLTVIATIFLPMSFIVGFFGQNFGWMVRHIGGEGTFLVLGVGSELAVLVGGLTAALGMLALNRLPMPYHPLFNVPRFARATQDRFFLAIDARDARFERGATAELLHGLGAAEVSEVAR